MFYKLKIITLEEKDLALNLLDKCSKKDVFCHPSYLKIFQDYSKFQAIYVYYGDGDNFILVPYFKRPIELLGKNSGYFDIVSPWYYGGPIHNIDGAGKLREAFLEFQKEFDIYCLKNNIITEFQRLNPFLGNYKFYENDSGLCYDRKIVYVDLTKDVKTIYGEYDRHARKNINKAERSNLKIYSDITDKSVEKFIDLYTNSMKQKKAKDFYYFNKTFFQDLFKVFKDNVKLFYAEYNGKIICSSIELGKYGILHDYLRGADSEYLALRPNDAVINEIIKWSKDAGYKYFSMGGGSSNAKDDGILKFKKSFSSTTADFHIYKKIHNLEKYKELCEKIGKDKDALNYQKADFFPEYFQMK